MASTAMEISQQAVEVVSKVTGLGALAIGGALPIIGAGLSVVASIFGLAGLILRSTSKSAMEIQLENLHNKLSIISDDIREMGLNLKWDEMISRHHASSTTIANGVEYLKLATGAVDEVTYKHWLKNLYDLSGTDQQRMKSAVYDLKVSLTDGGVHGQSMLETLYTSTEGDRGKIKAVATRVIQLLASGMMIVVITEHHQGGDAAGRNFAEVYQNYMRDIERNTTAVLQRCENDFKANLKIDLEKELRRGGGNQDIVQRLSAKIDTKYDFMDMMVIVYNDIAGFSEHCICGSQVNVLHVNAKCGTVFYQRKTAKQSSRKETALQIVRSLAELHGENSLAQKIWHKIKHLLSFHNVAFRGISVVRRYVYYRISYYDTRNTVFVVGKGFTYFILLAG